METLIDQYGEGALMLTAGLVTGVVFGMAAYRSRFCLRAATIEVSEGRFGPRLAIWLIAFSMALFCVQTAIWLGLLDVSSARQLASTGSMSGAILGGLLFGVGMVLARGCASRLLVLSASGNLRAIVTGLVLTLAAQASLRGVLASPREHLAGLWTIQGGEARALLPADLSNGTWLVLGAALLVCCALALGVRRNVPWIEMASAAVVGFAIYVGWQLTYVIANASFEIVAIQSVTFTGPSTDTLMAFVNARALPLSFGLGLVSGVFVGAMVTAFSLGEARIQRFEPDVPMERYLVGGTLMGFGSMLAGGCAVGAGLTGGSVLALTAWVAVFFMWVGAMATHLALRLTAQAKLA